MVAIAEDRVEPGQLPLVSDDDPFAARQAGPQCGRVDDERDLRLSRLGPRLAMVTARDVPSSEWPVRRV